MEITPRQRHIKVEGSKEKSDYQHVLQFYTIPPTENITLHEFEDLALERLKVLKIVETLGIRHLKQSAEYRDAMKNELKKFAKDGILRNLSRVQTDQIEDVIEDQRRDNISHFILRLAYCKTDELRRWFIAQEVDLFRFRFQQQPSASIQDFLRLNKLTYLPISKEEKESLCDQLLSGTSFLQSDFRLVDFYKVHFTEVLELVRSTKVYLEKGFAYVPQGELVTIVSNAFRTRLSRDLVVMSRSLFQLSEEDRLLPMLSNLSKQYLGQDYGNRKPTAGQITADMIDALSKSTFPLCMQQLHQSLRQTHHMKHWGRLQYGLFLKGIGLSLDEALKFWKAEFLRTMDADKFAKQYAYNIRYNYGKEGKRSDFTPYSCVKIITTNPPAAGDAHGCPFRHWDVDMLKQRLKSMQLSTEGVTEVSELAKQGHYQLACGRFFELKNNVEYKFTPQHPNQYFEEGQKVSQENRPDGSRPEAGTSSGNTVQGVKIVAVSKSSTQQPIDNHSHVDHVETNDHDMDNWEDMDASEFM